MRQSLVEIEPHSTEYVSIFSHVFRDEIINLLLKIAKCIYSSDTNQSKKIQNVSDNPNNLVSSVMNYLFNDPTTSTVLNNSKQDSSKTKQHLESSINFISTIFNIQQQSIETIINNEKNASCLSSNMTETDSSTNGNCLIKV